MWSTPQYCIPPSPFVPTCYYPPPVIACPPPCKPPPSCCPPSRPCHPCCGGSCGPKSIVYIPMPQPKKKKKVVGAKKQSRPCPPPGGETLNDNQAEYKNCNFFMNPFPEELLKRLACCAEEESEESESEDCSEDTDWDETCTGDTTCEEEMCCRCPPRCPPPQCPPPPCPPPQCPPPQCCPGFPYPCFPCFPNPFEMMCGMGGEGGNSDCGSDDLSSSQNDPYGNSGDPYCRGDPYGNQSYRDPYGRGDPYGNQSYRNAYSRAPEDYAGSSNNTQGSEWTRTTNISVTTEMSPNNSQAQTNTVITTTTEMTPTPSQTGINGYRSGTTGMTPDSLTWANTQTNAMSGMAPYSSCATGMTPYSRSTGMTNATAGMTNGATGMSRSHTNISVFTGMTPNSSQARMNYDINGTTGTIPYSNTTGTETINVTAGMTPYSYTTRTTNPTTGMTRSQTNISVFTGMTPTHSQSETALDSRRHSHKHSYKNYSKTMEEGAGGSGSSGELVPVYRTSTQTRVSIVERANQADEIRVEQRPIQVLTYEKVKSQGTGTMADRCSGSGSGSHKKKHKKNKYCFDPCPAPTMQCCPKPHTRRLHRLCSDKALKRGRRLSQVHEPEPQCCIEPPPCPIRETKASILRKRPPAKCNNHKHEVPPFHEYCITNNRPEANRYPLLTCDNEDYNETQQTCEDTHHEGHNSIQHQQHCCNKVETRGAKRRRHHC